VDFGYLVKTATRESANNPLARAATSSAAGLFQFVDQTWLATLKQYGAKHGYGGFADLIEKGVDGRFRVENAGARRAVMNLKLDPQASALMAGELTADHADYLRARVGREPTGATCDRDEGVRLFTARSDNPARAVIFERPTKKLNPIGEQRRGQTIPGKSRIGSAVTADLKRRRTVDATACRQTISRHRRGSPAL
jgi:hypothetical protein